ncbi:chloride channel protein [Flavobacterium selenitireducens]|uniref:chloride channel protein n=1 Tax=Flavobacterium selenitireducens TaxID=2722704 RepID=UPI00168A761E|nr:chloride channel protein [Flavobacterium selenitireducens]MBD3581368.1 chloride channel protein [Flavobacterium selenitireducens]
MTSKSKLRARLVLIKWAKLLGIALLIGVLASFVAISLKLTTEHYEEMLFEKTRHSNFLLVVFPVFGLGMIFLLRQYVFRKKENKGIAEVFDSLKTGKGLPMYKVPSHFVNGLLTVAFGGPTGIEVSTVVASAAVGSVTHDRQSFFRKYKTEMICAGISAGLTALFNSPMAGMLFSLEVITRKRSLKSFLIMAMACFSALVMAHFLSPSDLFHVDVTHWNYGAIPYFIGFALFASLNSVYLTKSVLWFKSRPAIFSRPEYKILVAALIIGGCLLVLPQLYGDGYHGLSELFLDSNTRYSLGFAGLLATLLIVKPLLVSVALWGGGDGGVFAPSLVTGAIAGLLFAMVANHFFNAHLIPINFMLIGMGAVLSATIHAPFTAVFLVCGITGNYVLILPLLLVCVLSKIASQKMYRYNVYTYKPAS